MYVVVLVTAKNKREAGKIAIQLVKDELIACANIIDDVQSIFSWKGKLEKAGEVLLILKARKKCFPAIVKSVKAMHSYKVPEIIALPILDGNKEYLKWVGERSKLKGKKK